MTSIIPAWVASEDDHAALEIDSLSKSFAAGRVLIDFTITLAKGEVLALVGENGSGKSTLIKTLSGYHQPDPGGRVVVDGVELEFGSPSASYAAGCRFVHQDLGLVDSMSIADNLSLTTGFPSRFGTVSRGRHLAHVRQQLALVGLTVDPRALVASLSPAQQTSVAVARALNRDSGHPAKVLVLDEPTATLPLAEVELLLDMVRLVKSRGLAVVYVTHRLDEIFQIADRVSVLRNGVQVATVASHELDHDSLITLLVGRQLEAVRALAAGQAPATALPTLQVTNLRAAQIEDVSVVARPGEVVGIAGLTGSGRDAILPAIFGAVPVYTGTIRVAGSIVPHGSPRASIASRMAYLPPDRKIRGAVMDLTVWENLLMADVARHWRFPRFRRQHEQAETIGWFESLDIRPVGAHNRPFLSLSGGNQQKVLFAKWLRTTPAVLLLDEPTQGVDVGAKATIHARLGQLAADGATVLVNSSEVEELASLCHRVYVMRNGRVVVELVGSDASADAIAAACLGGKMVA